MDIQTEQEKFWMGQFGEEYIARNRSGVENNLSFFSRILSRTSAVDSIIELGANIGLNLIALHQLLPKARLAAVEINSQAVAELKQQLLFVSEIYHESILNFHPQDIYDLVFTKGVLIHINPDKLSSVYELLYKSSRRYILIAEYYNPQPVEVVYRGHGGRLYKRDFAGEFMDKYSDCQLIDYGFVYHVTPCFRLTT
jgi:spore coat polysaccharide biosynthesis protein SpsF